MKFDIRQTNIAKGVAILLLLWHHLFLSKPKLYVSLFSIGALPVERLIAQYGKCCVAVFMFLSGYGLFKSYQSYLKRNRGKPLLMNDVVFIKNRIIKLMSNYWFVYLLFVPLGLFFGRKFYEVYGNNPLHYLADIFGLSYLFYRDSFTMNATWWYISEILVFYALFPLLYKLYGKIRWGLLLLCCAFCIVPGVFRGLNIYLYAFVFGMVFADAGLFEACDRALNTKPKKLLPVAALLPLLIIRYYLHGVNLIYAMKFDGILVLPLLLISFLILSRIPYLNRLLEALGKRSGLIFLFHTFICGYYFKEYVYALKYPVLIFIVMVAVSYLIALALELLMKITKYQQLIKKCTT